RPNGDAALDYGLKKFILAIDLGARGLDVGEHAARTAKHAVLQLDPLVDAYIVLDLATFADADIRPDHDILANDAIATNDAAFDDMREMPYASILANLTALVDDSGLVRVIGWGIVRRYWSAYIRQLFRSSRPHRPLGRIKNPQDLQSLKPIGANWSALTDAIEEMAAFLDERLALDERDWHRSRLVGNRNLIAPFDPGRKELQFLVPALTVIKHGHGPIADEY